ncbi:SPRY domain-containing SOCS box protein 4 [Homalodisca vitripennis]|nr:SPRY domain-containing SOCS box protein 4 [Homalodisca vitripennis]
MMLPHSRPLHYTIAPPTLSYPHHRQRDLRDDAELGQSLFRSDTVLVLRVLTAKTMRHNSLIRRQRSIRNWRRISSSVRSRRLAVSRGELRRQVRHEPGLFPILLLLANVTLEDILPDEHYDLGAEDEVVGGAAAVADGLEEFRLPDRVIMLVEAEKSPSFFQELEKYAWNPQDCSRNIHFKEEFPLTCFLSTSTGAADAVRGRVGFSQGIHMWAIHWPAHLRGLHPMVGVATKHADLHSNGINSIVGSDDQSWGWNLSTLRLRHDCSMDSADYPVVAPYDDFEVPDSFGVVLDMYKGTLGFLIRVGDRRCYLGDAFTGLHGKVIFPIISTSSVPCQVTITYNGGLDSEPRSLMEICKKFVMQTVEDDELDKIEELDLPQTVIKYLLD